MENLATRPGWNLLAVRPKDSEVVYKEDSADGTFLLLARPGKRPRTSVLSFNTYFRDVMRPQRRMLSHTFADGSIRRGLLQLPIGHRARDTHPVIVWAYPNSTPALDDSFSRGNDFASVIYPVQYLLTQGFAFFQAPFPIGGKRSLQPMQAAVDAVVPWLDVLDRQAEIVPGACGFFGHSNAGYVALALEALTRRFKAIVAWDTFPLIGYDTLHSWADDVALDCAGNLIQSDRMFYEDLKDPYAPQPSPPWKRPKDYIRSEPLFNLNQASTPLLLVEGEFDTDPREMEEVYSILYGRGVPVELAYYWGEDHVFASPGNIHDTWVRTGNFFRK
jgi:dipeptidyl aminopeptidase/acylaminoacyl peptidase